MLMTPKYRLGLITLGPQTKFSGCLFYWSTARLIHLGIVHVCLYARMVE